MEGELRADLRGCLDPQKMQRFLAAVPSVHKGDDSALFFTAKDAHATFNGRLKVDLADPHFAELTLTTSIGAVPPTLRLKRELLGVRD